jgi:hypothetical protein
VRMNYDEAIRRYREDAEFHGLVSRMLHAMEALHLTPAELREAATFAAVQFELERTRPAFSIKADRYEIMRKEAEGFRLRPIEPMPDPIRYKETMPGPGRD